MGSLFFISMLPKNCHIVKCIQMFLWFFCTPVGSTMQGFRISISKHTIVNFDWLVLMSLGVSVQLLMLAQACLIICLKLKREN